MPPPLIGITTVRLHAKRDSRLRDALSQPYANAVVQAGGAPVLIPLGTLETGDEAILRVIYERVDGIMLPGGGDIHPRFFNDDVSEFSRGIHELRDKVELTLARWSYEDDRPVLGICRGHQVINVALGGTLLHDITATLNGNALAHDQEIRTTLAHEVQINPNSRLATLLETDCLPVNSLHHQAVKDLAPPLTATAYSSDGIIEGIEVPEARFCVGVQWHPEDIVQQSPPMQTLFRRFVETCG